jgi:YVTN family beta-propeller protein
MRLIACLLVLSCIVSLAPGQWVETTIYLPDSLSGLDSICAVQFHSPNHTVYVGGNDKLVAVDAGTHRKLARITSPGPLDLMCSSTASNKLYCASLYQDSVWVMDCATNHFGTTVALDGRVREMCYAAASNKVYVACPPDSLVDVIDCETDSVVAKIELPSWPSALCYNPELNRIYVAKSTSDEVAVIDCDADTVISTIWVHGVYPTDICYDSATNCVYTANHTSGTVSVIDCAGDSLVRIAPAGAKPDRMVVGPEGKVYIGGYTDSVVTVIEPQGTRTIPVGRYLSSMSFDPVNNKVYCAMSDSEVVVVDAIGDTVVARVSAGEDLRFICYDPVDTNTWAASRRGATVGVIDGASDRLIDMLWFGIFAPGTLCYSPVSDRLYCLTQYNQTNNLLIIIDGDSNRLLKVLPAGNSADSMVWNPANNKVYFSNSADNTVSIVDCASDSITATVETGEWPSAMCCSDDGKVYVTTNDEGVAVIDPSGDSIRAVVPTPYDPTTLCYDRTDNKVYAGLGGRGQVYVIDVGGDSVVAAVSVVQSSRQVCWNQNHNKVYVCAPGDRSVAVIDCTGDTVQKSIDIGAGPWIAYSDSACDKVYVVAGEVLYAINAAADTLAGSLFVWNLGGILDNGLPGLNNRLYCTNNSYPDPGLNVISGAADSILRFVPFGTAPTALAWNPVHSWVYVSNPGGSSITVVSDTMLCVEENEPQASSHKLQATVVRGVLFLHGDRRPGTGDRAAFLDISGRKVMDLKPGANDVSALAPGVYFVRSEPSAVGCQPSAVNKVVVTR